MPSNSSSSLNTRIFAPYVILSQNTSRLLIKISTGQGYSIVSGITLGDVIRFDPTFNSGGLTGQYVKSQANTDANAEVLGVVESYSSGSYNIVIHGSVSYPTSRLIGLCGGNGGVDILFLSAGISGGLTGIAEEGATETIVKPVIQLAPHGSIYNGVVVNYIGFKINGSGGSRDALLGESQNGNDVGEIVWTSDQNTLNSNWINLKDDVLLETDDYQELFNIYGIDNGPWVERLTFNFNPHFSLLNKNTYQINNSGFRVNSGNIINVSENFIDVEQNTPNITENILNSKQYVSTIINGSLINLDVVSRKIYKFTVPAIESNITLSQNNINLVPYINSTSKPTIVRLPPNIKFDTLTVGGTFSLGAITNLENKITAMQSQIDQLNSRII